MTINKQKWQSLDFESQKSSNLDLLSNPKVLVILFSLLFAFLLLTVGNKTRPQYQSIQYQPYHQFNLFDYVKLNTTTALCLDGSPAGYYISKEGDPSKILLFFQGGGWCRGLNINQTLEDCWGRSKTQKGSTNSHPQSKFLKIDQGILSKDPKNYFKDWKKVFLIYCDGSGHQGTKSQPIKFKDTKLYFRGHNITVERFQDLQKRIGLFSKSKQVVVTGCSAGGLAAYHWANYVTERVKTGKVNVIGDSGIFYDANQIKSRSPIISKQYKSLMQIVNKQIELPVPQCVLKNFVQKQKCMLAQNIIGQIKAPVFVIQGLYDYWSIRQILGIQCVINRSLKSCSPIEKYVIEENRINFLNVLKNVQKNRENGIWAPSCSHHCFTTSSAFYNENFRIPVQSQNSVSRTIQKWIENSTSNNIYIDKDGWPYNSKCSGINYFV